MPGAVAATRRWKLPRSSSFSASTRVVAEADEDVARLEPRLLRRRVVGHRVHDDAADLGLAEVRGEVAIERLDRDAEPAALDAAVADLREHVEHRVHRDREADAAPLAARVDADDAALEVHERTARRAAVDHRVGLDEVVQQLRDLEVAALRRDDPERDGAVEAVRVADGEHPLADAHLFDLAEVRGRERRLGLDAQHGEVGLLVVAEHLGGIRLLPALHRDLDLVRALDHVVVREHEPFRARDHARAGDLGLAVVHAHDRLHEDDAGLHLLRDGDDAVFERKAPPARRSRRARRPGRAAADA